MKKREQERALPISAIARALAYSRPSGYGPYRGREDDRVWRLTYDALTVAMHNRGLLPTEQDRQAWYDATRENVR